MLTPAFAVALLAGALACLLLPEPPGGWLLGCVLALVVLWRRRLPAVFCAGFVLAGLHAGLAMSRQLPVTDEHRVFDLCGAVAGMPRHEARRTRFDIDVDDDRRMPMSLRGRRLRLAWYDDYGAGVPSPGTQRLRVVAGSRWCLSAKVRAPRGLRNPGGVDGEKHALIDRIAATGSVRHPQSARMIAAASGLDAWRETMSRRIEHAVPSASSRFLRALALGDTRALDDADWARLRATGLTHLIAISGFHVGLVAGFFALLAKMLWWWWPGLCRRCPRPQASAVAALAGALSYAAVAGFALPTVRTVLMIAAIAFARCSRRGIRAWDAVSMSVVAMLAFDPLSLLSAGFWLSFAGVAWLLWCLPRHDPRIVRGFVGAQAVATVGLLPLTVALFGQASLAGPVVNLLAIPWWSLLVVPLSLIGMALETLHVGWGGPVWRLAAAVFDPSWSLFSWMAAGPLALWWLPEPAVVALPLAMLSAFWCLLPRGVPGKCLAMLLWLPLLWPDRRLPGEGEVELVVFDVGQGLSVLVRTADHQLLYDMGPAMPEGFDAGERAVVPALHALGVQTLDAAVVSHGDNDHAGGFESIAGAFPPHWRFAPPGSGLEDRIARLRACRAGLAWQWDGVRFRFLHPPPHFPYLKNESSCVLRIESQYGAALLVGDIGQVIERDLLRRDPGAVRAKVVVMAHHGSDGSSDPGFVAATGAIYAPVSAGHGNRFRHPRAEVLERWQGQGARTPSTALSGALRLRFTPDGVQLSAERERHRRLWDAAARRARAE